MAFFVTLDLCDVLCCSWHVARSRVQKPDIIILDHDNGILKKTFLLILLQTGNVTLSFNCRLRMSVAPKSLHIGARWLQ